MRHINGRTKLIITSLLTAVMASAAVPGIAGSAQETRAVEAPAAVALVVEEIATPEVVLESPEEKAALPRHAANAIDLCESGHMAACSAAGEHYFESKDFAEALAYFDRACDLGRFTDCYNAGNMHERGTAGTVSFERAVDRYERSCWATDAFGCVELAGLHRDGKGTTQDYRSALVLFRKACDGEIADGCRGLAAMNEAGQGTKVDKLLSKHLMKKARKIERGDEGV